MAHGLITFSEKDLGQLQRGEILNKTTVDGAVSVNCRLVVPQGLSHTEVMDRARSKGFRGPAAPEPVDNLPEDAPAPPPSPTLAGAGAVPASALDTLPPHEGAEPSAAVGADGGDHHHAVASNPPVDATLPPRPLAAAPAPPPAATDGVVGGEDEDEPW